MSSADTRKTSSNSGDTSSAPNKDARSKRFATAGTAALGGHVEYVEQCDTRGHLTISYNSCRRVPSGCIARSARRWRARNGWRPDSPNCCRFRISMSCSLCPSRSALWRFRTHAKFTVFCSAPRRKRYSPSRGGPETVGSGSRLSVSASYPGPEPPPSSAPALRRARRRTEPGRRKVD